MSFSNTKFSPVEAIKNARRIADHAVSLGIEDRETKGHSNRIVSYHLGAVLADSVLQAGLNYHTVVRPRVKRILEIYPDTDKMSSVMLIIKENKAAEFLDWNHHEKVSRFVEVVNFLNASSIQNVCDLRDHLQEDRCRNDLLGITGIGPKTVDYLSCLVGLDCIAVDRHVKLFVENAGLEIKGYDSLKLVVSYAADLLGIARRDFDSWMWSFMSSQRRSNAQYQLL
jgi:hypothetical protein